MIVFNLVCLECEYPFEGWFDDTKSFNSQKKRKLINCPNCESSNVSKTLVAPNVSKKSNSKSIKNKKTLASNIKKIKKIVEKNFDYVGENFSKKVREVYYDKKNKKAIYGTTTPEEREELAEEGIDLFSIPWVNKDN